MAYSRLEKLRNRRLDPRIKVAGLNEAYNKLGAEDGSVQYAISAMQPIDPDYTRRTIEERTRVENQLADGFESAGVSVEFDYQGSVTNDTHIRVYSDVDLLTVDQRWFRVEPPNTPTHTYTGNAIDNLKELRNKTVEILRSSFPAAAVDDSGSKAVNISGGSLQRKIDLIASAWWHTVEYIQSKEKHWLGIQVLDNDRNQRISNKPFLHNKRIADRDESTNGGCRKLIRLLKSLKYDSDDRIDLTSYDIAAIVYNMPDSLLISQPGQDLKLVNNAQLYLRYLSQNSPARYSIEVPNEMRKVFCDEGATDVGLLQMLLAVDVLIREINQGLSRSFRKLAEARVFY